MEGHVEHGGRERSRRQYLAVVQVAQNGCFRCFGTELCQETVVVASPLAQPVPLRIHSQSRYKNAAQRSKGSEVEPWTYRLPQGGPGAFSKRYARFPVSPAQLVLGLADRHDDVVPRLPQGGEQLGGARLGRG